MITRENTLRGCTVVDGEERRQLVEIIGPDGKVMKELSGGPFAWGPPTRGKTLEQMATDNIGRINLAKALLGWLLGPDDPRVTQYFQRYKHRVAMTLAPDWTMRASDIEGVVEAIIVVENETAQSRTMVAMTPAPIVSERGADIVWDTDDKGRRITRPGE